MIHQILKRSIEIYLLITVLCTSLAFGAKRDEFGRRIDELATHFKIVGDPCDIEDSDWYPDSADPYIFVYCKPKTRYSNKGVFVGDKCAKREGVQMQFDYFSQNCFISVGGIQRFAAGSARVGDVCNFNTDCLRGAYCNSGQCSCLSDYIDYNFYCYQKIQPSQSGCTLNEQCNSVWPGATCLTSTCQCPKTPTDLTAKRTRDGVVCTDDSGTTARCALPAGAGQLTVASTITTPASCTYPGTCTVTGSDGVSLYDCLDKPTKSTTVTGVCCPSRAFACIMPPKSSGTGGQRWYYNAVTATCQTFIFGTGATEANANNFETREHCESYCLNACKRGPAQFTSTAPTANYLSCTGTSVCDGDHECANVGSTQQCCGTTTWICGPNGGTTVQSGNGFNAGVTLAATLGGFPGNRWYYNPQSQTCQIFNYLGGGGNFNNFASSDDCNNFCKALLCDYGSPLQSSYGGVNTYQSCSGSSGCPTSYTCTNSVCCPSNQQICSQSKAVGTCQSYTIRYYFNRLTRQCEQFEYSGCQGNDNNFETYTACSTACQGKTAEPLCIQGTAWKDNQDFRQCSTDGGNGFRQCPPNYECYNDGTMNGCCPIKTYTCSLPNSSGNQCGPDTTRWYYDTTTQTCQTFTYRGCDGNSNNFPSRQLCENYCGVGGCPNGGSTFRDAGNTIRVCSAAVPCPSGYSCDRVRVSTSTNNYCCPTRASICQQPPSAGFGSGSCSSSTTTRYYFNSATRICQTFEYNGCAGASDNNFGTLTECSNFCAAAACLAGEVPLEDPNTRIPQTCNPSLAQSCPVGYTCRNDGLTGRDVCCGSPNTGQCPAGEKVFMDATTRRASLCTPGRTDTCFSSPSNNFVCRRNAQDNLYYCCASASGSVCPTGKLPLLDTQTNLPQQCALGNVINSCRSINNQIYSCQSAVSGAFRGYCCTENTICPGGGEFEQFRTGSRTVPRQCNNFGGSFNQNQCGAGYTCQSPTGSTTGYCCRGGGNSAQFCRGGGQVLFSGGVATECFANQVGSCPSTYACTPLNPTNPNPPNKSYCCRGDTNGQCPPNWQVSPTKPNCQITLNDCPGGYSCQYSYTFSNYFCCTQQQQLLNNGVCPAGLSQSPTQPTCDINQNNCPFGYSCQYSQTTRAYYCCGNPNNNVVVNCNANQVRVGNQCLNRVNPNSQCQTSEQCLGGSTCTNSFCQCPAGTTPNGAACQTNAITTCPNNAAVYLNAFNRQPQGCTPNVLNNCPPGYSCQRSSSGNNLCCAGTSQQQTSYIFVYPNQGGNGCPVGQNVYLIPNTNRPQTCSPGSFQTGCPSGYTCTRSQFGQFQCCGNGANFVVTPTNTNTGRNGCPRGGPLIFPGTSSPIVCPQLAGGRNPCPGGYTCLPSTNVPGTNYCCSSTRNKKRKQQSLDGNIMQNEMDKNNKSSFVNSTTGIFVDPSQLTEPLIIYPITTTTTTSTTATPPIAQRPPPSSSSSLPISLRKSPGYPCVEDGECQHYRCISDGSYRKVCACSVYKVLDFSIGRAACRSSCKEGLNRRGVCVPPHRDAVKSLSEDFLHQQEALSNGKISSNTKSNGTKESS